MPKIKHLLFIMILSILFISNVYAKESIEIKSITLDTKSENTIINSEPTFSGLEMNYDLTFKEVNDFAKYKIIIENNTNKDYKVSEETSFNLSEYVTYSYESEQIIKANKTSTIFIIIKYDKEVDETLLNEGKYSETNKAVLQMINENNEAIVNPDTGIIDPILPLIVISILSVCIVVIINKKEKSIMMMLLIGICLIPVVTYAIESLKLTINVKVDIEKVEAQSPVVEDYYLMEAGYVTSATDRFLRTSINRNNIEKITFNNSINEHSPNNTDCWDVSKERNGTILAWAKDDDNDGIYEITIGSNGNIYLTEGRRFFALMNKLAKIEGLDLLNTSKVTNMEAMFERCFLLTELDLSTFDTSQVTNMSQMFGACVVLNNLNISTWDTSKVTNMSSMFSNCRKLTSLDLSNFNTAKVTNMGAMFQGCSSLTTLNISSFNTENVTTFNGLEISEYSGNFIDNGMFQGCNQLTSLDLSNFNTSKVINMSHMFYSCASLSFLNMSTWDTSQVTNMSSMFAYMNEIEQLDISSFDTSQVTNMREMFRSNVVKTIYVSNNFNTDIVTMSGDMFKSTENLVGGSGTVYTKYNPTDKTYAHVDGGTSNPGYFTLKQ